LRSALLDDFGSDESKLELMKKLGISCDAKPDRRRSTMQISKDVKSLGGDISVDDYLDESLEEKYIEILE